MISDVGAFERLCAAVGVDPWEEPYARVEARAANHAYVCSGAAHAVLDACIIAPSFGAVRMLAWCVKNAHLARRRLEVVRMRRRST